MAWYEGTYACGHEGRVNIIGPQKDRGFETSTRLKSRDSRTPRRGST